MGVITGSQPDWRSGGRPKSGLWVRVPPLPQYPTEVQGGVPLAGRSM